MGQTGCVIKTGDMVVHKKTGVIGQVVKQYFPTSCAQQTMVRTLDGRIYHAPTDEWQPYNVSDLAAPLCQNAVMDATAPIAVKHDYRHIKIDENTTVTIDLEDMKKQIAQELHKDFDLYRGLHYGA